MTPLPSVNEPTEQQMSGKSVSSLTQGRKNTCKDGSVEGIFIQNEEDAARGESHTTKTDQNSPSQNPLIRFFNLIVPRGGSLAGMLNLASVTLGAGIVSLPSAFNTSGIILAVIYLVVVTAFTIFSISLLVSASERTGFKSFENLARGLLGRGADYVVASLLWLLCFGGAVGYVVAMGDVLRPILAHDKTPTYLKTDGGRRVIMSCIWILFMFPLALPKQVNSLRYASGIGVLFVLFFVICVVVHSAQKIHSDGHLRSDLVFFRSGNDAVSGVSIFIFAYLCQVNCFKIFYERRIRSVRGMAKDAAASCGICCLLYFLVGFFGYAEFGPEIEGSILRYFSPYSAPVFFVCYAGIIIKLCAAFSLNMLACRTALFQVMDWDVDTMSYWKHSLFSVTFAVGALVLGLFVPDINIVFGLVGAFCGGFIGFVFPSLFMMYSGNWSYKTVGVVQYVLTYVLLLMGVVAIAFGTTSTIYSTIQRFS